MYIGDDMKTIQCKCSECGAQFTKELKEYNRQLKKGRTKFYCSLRCSGSRSENISMIRENSKPYHFKGGEKRHITVEQKLKSSMREFSKRVRARKSKFVGELDLDSMVNKWNNQKGLCAITNVKLILQYDDSYKTTSNNYKASIDRIDSSKPYTIDNIQFVSLSVNNLKSNMASVELSEFIQIIKNL
jgi:hypothetical protein